MIDKKTSLALDNLLNSDEGTYAYLFPNRKRLPKVKEHIFTGMSKSPLTVDEFVIDKMLNIDYVGWTAKNLLNIDLFPFQIAMLQVLWKTPFPMVVGSRGSAKSFTLAVYAILKALLEPGSKIVIVGAGLRQAKLVFNYVESIWNNAPVLRDIVGKGKGVGPRQSVDLCYFKMGTSMITSLPLGDGSRIRGFRATTVLADEFASIPEEIFDIVVRGFTATAKTPIEEARQIAIERRIAELDLPTDICKQITGTSKSIKGNQIVYSGTAYYGFNHFAKKFNMWRTIIESKGDYRIISNLFGGDNNIPDDFDYRDYAIVRVPYTVLPEGMLDKKQLAHARAVLPSSIFQMEYCASFVKDSNGFFPRSLIEQCTVGPDKPIETPDGAVVFTPAATGEKNRKYVMGIDPAAERDNFAISIIEVWQNHRRVVYCWVVNKSEFIKRKKAGFVTDDDYYAYCCSKIIDLVKNFNPVRIEMDCQGGGYAISEMLRNKKLIDKSKNNFPIYEIVDLNEPKDTDGETDGRHILHLVQQSSDFNQNANIALHKSLETKVLLFPAFDTVKMCAALEVEKAVGVMFDTYEEIVLNIEELKNEICTIQMTETATGKEKFDTPSVVQPGSVEGRKRTGRLVKDRYTSLLLANKYAYDLDTSQPVVIDYDDIAGNMMINKNKHSGDLYRGPGVGRMRNSEHFRGGSPLGAIKRGERLK